MGIEIERKYLVKAGFTPPATGGTPMVQGYLSASRELTVRIRKMGEKARLTLKGPTVGLSRKEFEYPVPPADAAELLEMVTHGKIEKTRYEIEFAEKLWEVDVFHGDNQGLVMAEIELSHEDEPFESPPWLGPEVSRTRGFTNSALATRPFNTWSAAERKATGLL